MRKNKLSLALALALGVGIAASSSSVMAVTLGNDDGLGDAGIFQYYTAQEGWQTFVRIINTSDKAASVKVRFREAANSREVLDFIVFMSPHDMWVAWTDKDATGNGVPGIRTNDSSCIYPGELNNLGQGFVNMGNPANPRLIGADFSTAAFTGVYWDGTGHSDTARLSEGHIEVIGIAEHDPSSDFGRAIRHENGLGGDGIPTSCANARALWEQDFAAADDSGAVGEGMGNILGMNGYLVNVSQGQGGGYDPDILREFVQAEGWDSQTVDWRVSTDSVPGLSGLDENGSLWTASHATATDPDLDSATTFNFGGATNWLKQKGKLMNCGGSAATCSTSVTGGVDAVSYAFQRASVINEWAAALNENNIVFDYYTQWILTFPTKHYYVDLQTDGNWTDDISPTLYDPSVNNDAFAPFANEFIGSGSCEPFSIDMWNRDEASSSYVSPEGDFPAELCWETNVLVFSDVYTLQGLNSKFSTTVPVGLFPVEYDPITDADIKSEKGWASLNFYDSNGGTGIPFGIEQGRHIGGRNLGPDWPDNHPFGSDEFNADEEKDLGGLPVTGFLFSIFNTGSAVKNHTTINSHKYRRDIFTNEG